MLRVNYMNSSQPKTLTGRRHGSCRALTSSANQPMARLSRSNLFSIFLTEHALMRQFAVFQLMRPLLLRPGFWQRRDNTD